VPMRN